MELVMTIHVVLTKNIYSVKGKELDICMLPFTGIAEGPYFNGKVLGEGVDTQKIYHDGRVVFSARYMMEGTDFKGNPCRVFVENNGDALEHLVPTVVTDSNDLQFLAEAELSSQVEPIENGVKVSIYKK